MLIELIKAIILGIVEGITEFLPISSTGHLILAERFIAFAGPLADTFAIFIQLGAILAVVWYYRQDIMRLLGDLPSKQPAQSRTLNLIVAFIPAAVVGVLLHKQIKLYLFNPVVIAASLILGGLAILWVERRQTLPVTLSMPQMSAGQALWIGAAQIISLIPGISRSAATIMGGMLGGLDRSTATEFSFWLAIPTLIAATLFDLATSLGQLQSGDLLVLAVGTIVSFFVAWAVIGAFLRYVKTNTFIPFAYYRIGLGILVLVVTVLV